MGVVEVSLQAGNGVRFVFGEPCPALVGGWMGSDLHGIPEASEETARKIRVRGDGGLDLDRDPGQCYG